MDAQAFREHLFCCQSVAVGFGLLHFLRRLGFRGIWGKLMQSDAGCASMPDELGSQSSSAQQQAVTPGPSFSEPKKRKG